MPLYFFDTHDGSTFLEDQEGIELDGFEAARLQAQEGLADMARDIIPGDGPERTMTVAVRDREGRTILRAMLTLNVEGADGSGQMDGHRIGSRGSGIARPSREPDPPRAKPLGP
ncbi:MAG TPA: hypothetical protein VHL98_18765 [Microvirga sp.]|jgi:hypothetical protein|nr:hypothetical protein [Microvirga sp.]